MSKAKAALAAAVVGAGVWLALRPQMRHAKLVGELSSVGTVMAPIEESTVARLVERAERGETAHGLKPSFVYARAEIGGVEAKVRPAYEEASVPSGGSVMSMGVRDFLVSVELDPEAEGAVLHGPGGARTFDRPTISRLTRSLERRGVR